MSAPTVFHCLYLMCQHLILWQHCSIIKTFSAILRTVSMSALILTNKWTHTNNLIFSILTLVTCNWSSGLFCKDAGIIISLPFITIPSVTTISSVKDQYGCISFMTTFCQWQVMHAIHWDYTYIIIFQGCAPNFFCHHLFWDFWTCFYGIYVQAHPQYCFISVFTVVVPR